ncbi:MAG: hypothetical protein O8C64_14420 [Candidatus Methanoperedens sp.]|nr:hypothetical protein [Candidatus Methanoperedens sp.]MCZ7406734.1 hypothetical protein [Candidatus Methanoperedens sp.]
MKAKTINEIRKDGFKTLAKSLGPIGMVRFIQSFDLGRGDYTKEQSQWISGNLDEIFKEIKEKRTRVIVH